MNLLTGASLLALAKSIYCHKNMECSLLLGMHIKMSMSCNQETLNGLLLDDNVMVHVHNCPARNDWIR